jgi:hypothetical protein
MLNRVLSNASVPADEILAGTVLLRRGQVASKALHLLSGRVALGSLRVMSWCISWELLKARSGWRLLQPC